MNLLRIDNLKINAYGNIKNKDLSLNKGINIIILRLIETEWQYIVKVLN